jgi:hypothetical protein
MDQKARFEGSQKDIYIYNHSILLMDSYYIEVTHNLFKMFYK